MGPTLLGMIQTWDSVDAFFFPTFNIGLWVQQNMIAVMCAKITIHRVFADLIKEI